VGQVKVNNVHVWTAPEGSKKKRQSGYEGGKVSALLTRSLYFPENIPSTYVS